LLRRSTTALGKHGDGDEARSNDDCPQHRFHPASCNRTRSLLLRAEYTKPSTICHHLVLRETDRVIPKASVFILWAIASASRSTFVLALKKWPQSAPSFAIYVLMREPGRKSIMLGIFFLG
jgi:hypothetical protein